MTSRCDPHTELREHCWRRFGVVRSLYGFTLIELLVVISIIALLVSILIPSLSKAREAAKKVVCKANLKQISLSAYMYGNDNNDIIVPYAYTWKMENGQLPTRLFPWLLRSYAPINPNENEVGKNIYMCTARTDYVVWDGQWHYTNYALNSVISPHSWYKPVRRFSSVRRHAECLFSTDSGNDYGRVSPVAEWYQPTYEYRPEFRHSDATNCLFLDGHVNDRARNNPFPDDDPTNVFWDGN